MVSTHEDQALHVVQLVCVLQHGVISPVHVGSVNVMDITTVSDVQTPYERVVDVCLENPDKQVSYMDVSWDHPQISNLDVTV